MHHRRSSALARWAHLLGRRAVTAVPCGDPDLRARLAQVTGHWPDYSNQEDLAKLGAEAFAFVNVARFAIPLRIGLALSTTPWVQSNIVDNFGKKEEEKEEAKEA